MIITTKKFKFNARFIDILNYCGNKYGYLERLDVYCSYSIFKIFNIIRYISTYNKKKYYYDIPNELKHYFKQKNNISDIAFTAHIIKYFVNKEILMIADKVDNKFFDTYITISNNDKCIIKQFTVHI